MPLPWFATDYQFLDGGQTVTLHQRRAGQDNQISISNAVFAPLSTRDLMAFGALGLTGVERKWTLNNSQVLAGSANPNDGIVPGDTIDDQTDQTSGVSNGTNFWQIIAARLESISTFWVCICRQQQPSDD